MLISVVAVVVAIAVGAAGWWFGDGRWTQVPTIVGQPRTVAEQQLSQAGLVVATVPGTDGKAPSGTVTAVDKPAGSRLIRGTTVTITVSTGLPRVPTIAPGTSVDDAAAELTAADYTPDGSGAREYSDTVDEDAVIRTDPPGDTELAHGGGVHLVISRGPDPNGGSGRNADGQIRVPSVTGLPFDAARAQLRGLGLDVQRDDLTPHGSRLNIVASQDPPPFSFVDPGSTVTLSTI
jgi:serine/threonine-protein kinase